LGSGWGHFKPTLQVTEGGGRNYPLETWTELGYIGVMAKPKPPTLKALQARFPTDDACLDHMMVVRYGRRFDCKSCGKLATYYRVKGRRSYECEWCGLQVYPTAGTPFENTRTPLTSWFFVMQLFLQSRNGVSAKEVQRSLGVTYKCAWRMCHKIREYMGYVDGDWPIGGHGATVEADKAFIGGRDKLGADDKKVVLGMVERGGDVVTRHIDDRSADSVTPEVLAYVKKGSRLMTDEAKAFTALSGDYDMETINHKRKEYVRGDCHTNTMEAFWANLKRGIQGTYVHVSAKHLQKYLWEFEFRHNMRRCPHLMLDTLLLAFPKPE
jgi:transposase